MRSAMASYGDISPLSWQMLAAHCRVVGVPKAAVLYASDAVPTSFAFVATGLLRVYVTDADGREYNKNFFAEGSFPGAMTALLTGTASRFTIEALEPSQVVLIDFKRYRELLWSQDDLKIFHIHYLESNWLLAKDAREVEIVQSDAATRYRLFVQDYPDLHKRLPQYHIAAHLGITPTQLSRVRKNFKLST
ncbi:hypothetical protein LPB72_03500 [Hydrogenophaga crassostreae]|uniref:Cyclic nucleotide-binding domain-containing protein n=2 Tax=Hydrogenophaga crassostreae TaxID=1763535 RepID=A0A167IYB6_9BURK|nr:hypothetical protein LPB072_17535 [Hydrogenophaga crassostreae]OAD43800.1 hypothetical protein LPB72_03500 [Hydrogenophaga crassostreae]